MPGLVLVGVFVVLPLLWILPISFGEPARGAFTAGGFTPQSYLSIVTDDSVRGVLLSSIAIAVIATLLAAVLALPLAYFMARSGPKLKSLLMVLIFFPLLVGTVVLSIGWMTILSPAGMVSQLAQQVGLVDSALYIMRTPVTVTVLISLILVPYVLLTLLSSIESVGTSTEQAAQSLGASRARAFWQITFPQIVPGVVAGTSLAFILAINAYPTPVLIGGGEVSMVSPEIYDVITRDGNWPQGTAMAIVVVIFSLVVTGLYGSVMARRFEKWRKIS